MKSSLRNKKQGKTTNTKRNEKSSITRARKLKETRYSDSQDRHEQKTPKLQRLILEESVTALASSELSHKEEKHKFTACVTPISSFFFFLRDVKIDISVWLTWHTGRHRDTCKFSSPEIN